MGFLDQKERVLDVALTNRGRQLLSKNLLNFTYFAFSDAGIDYSGSLDYVNTPFLNNAANRVQFVSTGSNGAGVTGITASLATVPTSGNILLAGIGLQATGVTLDALVQSGVEWTFVTASAAVTNGTNVELWMGKVGASAGVDVTVDNSGFAQTIAHIAEYNGVTDVELSASDVLDASLGSGSTGRTDLALQDRELFFGVISTIPSNTQTADDTSYTQVAITGSGLLRTGIYEKFTTVKEQAGFTASFSPNAVYAGVIATFKAKTNATNKSVTFDDYVHRNLSFEVTQKKNGKKLPTNTDLQHFLYTVPPNSRVLPQFDTNLDEDETLILERRFGIDNLILNTRKVNRLSSPLAYIMRATVAQQTLSTRLGNYVQDQRVANAFQNYHAGRNITGQAVGPNLLALNNRQALDTVTGASFSMNRILQGGAGRGQSALSFKRDIEVVFGTSRTSVDLKLRTADGLVRIDDGFLIEVFESGSDGSLVKLSQQNVENPINDEVKEEGFNSFLELRLDRF